MGDIYYTEPCKFSPIAIQIKSSSANLCCHSRGKFAAITMHTSLFGLTHSNLVVLQIKYHFNKCCMQ